MPEFLELHDENFVTVAFNLDHVRAITLTDAGHRPNKFGKYQPEVSIIMTATVDGILMYIPTVVEATPEHNSRVVRAFFDRLTGVTR
jgi:hypothetical protein